MADAKQGWIISIRITDNHPQKQKTKDNRIFSKEEEGAFPLLQGEKNPLSQQWSSEVVVNHRVAIYCHLKQARKEDIIGVAWPSASQQQSCCLTARFLKGKLVLCSGWLAVSLFLQMWPCLDFSVLLLVPLPHFHEVFWGGRRGDIFWKGEIPFHTGRIMKGDDGRHCTFCFPRLPFRDITKPNWLFLLRCCSAKTLGL